MFVSVGFLLSAIEGHTFHNSTARTLDNILSSVLGGTDKKAGRLMPKSTARTIASDNLVKPISSLHRRGR